ncbi:unnamed protein product [Brassica rapa]|uniref:Uncharacterized protein n=2 Tax=Brassica TaxID=3705 RepID=A0A8D9GYA7_BRACM|nr:unnamed protein product [Brassica napus]CAG7889243.1 unnamed protein product [Brassica rapa]
MVDAYFRTSLLSRQVKTFVVIVCIYVNRNTLGAYDDEEATAALKFWGPGTLISFQELLWQKKISGGAVKKNGGQGDVVVVGFTSHSLRLDEEDL